MRIVKKKGEFTLNEVRKICFHCQRFNDRNFHCPFSGIEVVACTIVNREEDDYSKVVEVELNERE